MQESGCTRQGSSTLKVCFKDFQSGTERAFYGTLSVLLPSRSIPYTHSARIHAQAYALYDTP